MEHDNDRTVNLGLGASKEETHCACYRVGDIALLFCMPWPPIHYTKPLIPQKSSFYLMFAVSLSLLRSSSSCCGTSTSLINLKPAWKGALPRKLGASNQRRSRKFSVLVCEVRGLSRRRAASASDQILRRVKMRG
jgi:hypothetical protein